MDSETLEEKKPEEAAAPGEEIERNKEEDKAEQVKEEQVKTEEADAEQVKEEGDQVMEEAEEKDKVEVKKRGRKGRKPKNNGQPKDPGQESATPKPRIKKRKVAGTPIERPARERKTIERYTSPSSEKASAAKAIVIPTGSGTQLKDIPNVAFKLSKRKKDENLHVLHSILFGKKGKAHSVKRNISQFSGFVWGENEEKLKSKTKEKIDKCVKEKLLDICDVLDVPVKVSLKKEDLSAKLLEFLESPHATTEILLSDKEKSKKGKKRRRKTTSSSEPTAGEPSAQGKAKKRSSAGRKKQKLTAKAEEKLEDEFETANSEGDSDEDNEDDIVQKEEGGTEAGKSDGTGESEEEEEQEKAEEQMEAKKDSVDKIFKGSEAKSRVKKTPPPKSGKSFGKKSTSSKKMAEGKLTDSPSNVKGLSTKQQKADEKKSPKSGSASSVDKTASKKQAKKSGAKPVKQQGKGKAKITSKKEPSTKELHAAVTAIVQEVDFDTVTLSDIIKQLGTQFGVDLMHRKGEVKGIVEEVINSMSDNGDDEEVSDENAEEAGDDAEADDDSDA